MLSEKIITKVPGSVPPNKKEKQGYIEDITKLTNAQLIEIHERQLKLLDNRIFIQKLHDKGERIRQLKNTLEVELKKRNELTDICNRLEKIQLNGKNVCDALEWEGKYTTRVHNFNSNKEKDADTDDNNLLRILANHSGTVHNKKSYSSNFLLKNNESNEEECCIKNDEIDPYAQNLCLKYNNIEIEERFLPFKTLRSNNLIIKDKKKDKNWEITAATPPNYERKVTKLISLQETLQLQIEQENQRKEIQLKHALDRLKEKTNFKIGELPDKSLIDYRDKNEISDNEEVHINDDDERSLDESEEVLDVSNAFHISGSINTCNE